VNEVLDAETSVYVKSAADYYAFGIEMTVGYLQLIDKASTITTKLGTRIVLNF